MRDGLGEVDLSTEIGLSGASRLASALHPRDTGRTWGFMLMLGSRSWICCVGWDNMNGNFGSRIALWLQLNNILLIESQSGYGSREVSGEI